MFNPIVFSLERKFPRYAGLHVRFAVLLCHILWGIGDSLWYGKYIRNKLIRILTVYPNNRKYCLLKCYPVMAVIYPLQGRNERRGRVYFTEDNIAI